jgi:hypothetical protein
MAQEISKLLKEATQGILTDETLAQIQEAFDGAVSERVKIHVEKALIEQDAEYTSKAEKLLEAIDADHCKKLQRVVEALDANNANKLQMVVNRYRSVIKEQATQFKTDLIDKISDYISIFIEQKIPQKAINEAVKNHKARIILNNLRENLAIDSALMSESLKDAVVDGKKQIDESRKSAEKLNKEVSQLRESLAKAKAELVLEQKTANLPPKKREYALRVFEGKTPKFIVENLDYTLSLFDKKEEERISSLKKEAFETRSVKADRVVLEEETQQSLPQTENNYSHVSNYLNEMSKY